MLSFFLQVESDLNSQETLKLTTLLGYLQSEMFETFLNESFNGINPDDDILSLMKLMTSRRPGVYIHSYIQKIIYTCVTVSFSFVLQII